MNQKDLEGNLIKYNLLKIFTKRVYLPLIAIFLTTIGGISLTQLGIIASVSAVVCLVLEIPTGYIADKWGHKSSLILGNFICSVSVLPYIFMPNFLGGLLASVLFFAGTSFSSGTIQAFIHETLLSLGRENEYVKTMGKAQSYGLIGNVVLISIVPLTYQINSRLPFLIGFFCLFTAFIISISLVKHPKQIPLKENIKKSLTNLKNSFSKNAFIRLLLVFVIFGISSAAFDFGDMYREIIFKNINIPIQYFGFILAIGSLFAAIIGRYIHLLKKLSPAKFYLLDILYISIAYLLVGITKNPLVIIFAFVLFPTYDRTRNIIFESQLFEEFSESNYKATLVSIMNFFPLVADIGVPLLLAFFVSQKGLFSGYILFSIILIIILIPILYIHNSIKNPILP